MAPEVYIALPPSGGIPALQRTSSAGTGSGTATTAQEWDTPGKATCQIYKIVEDSARVPNLIAISGLTKPVYNFSPSIVAQDWISIQRTKFGHWTPVVGGSGCESQNTIWDIIITGTPTGGQFSLTVDINDTSEVLTFDYNDVNSAVLAVFETHTEIAAGDVTVTNGPFPNATVRVEFRNNLANQLIDLPVASWASLTGGSGKSVIIAMSQRGHS